MVKFKRRKNYRRHRGHRQTMSTVRITKIETSAMAHKKGVGSSVPGAIPLPAAGCQALGGQFVTAGSIIVRQRGTASSGVTGPGHRPRCSRLDGYVRFERKATISTSASPSSPPDRAGAPGSSDARRRDRRFAKGGDGCGRISSGVRALRLAWRPRFWRRRGRRQSSPKRIPPSPPCSISTTSATTRRSAASTARAPTSTAPPAMTPSCACRSAPWCPTVTRVNGWGI